MSEVTRFAPSPTGRLHLGHAYAALFAAEQAGPEGRFLIRMEDIDRSRCRPEYETAIFEDLAWLGLTWSEPVDRQSAQLDAYRQALDRLNEAGLLYPCFCTRRDITDEIARSERAPHGPEGPLYPGTCRQLTVQERQARMKDGATYAWRLDMAEALKRTPDLSWTDRQAGRQDARPELLGDVVLARKDISTSYHLSVVVDDARQGITLVTRGEDLFMASHLHRLLQALLDLPVPEWLHHRLVTDSQGQRLAKRHDSLSLDSLRQAGESPQEIRHRLGFGAS
ncbi:tRNA glutamyl-Q(34) synthetase GluQRS [Fodinicurvata fenggangensis]|uniref:tRNA glutamyl-Q(34) synthetase GluQRS n=1 Tax=Fodinicurvata fenggangensis TaxID=1121830 RepID=UPI000479BF0C|nr:tRNA glutamyl-Q(34) synthetase GluQRS [Fodinicurvata fenggangensis]